jgi:hypothetical protein
MRLNRRRGAAAAVKLCIIAWNCGDGSNARSDATDVIGRISPIKGSNHNAVSKDGGCGALRALRNFGEPVGSIHHVG